MAAFTVCPALLLLLLLLLAAQAQCCQPGPSLRLSAAPDIPLLLVVLLLVVVILPTAVAGSCMTGAPILQLPQSLPLLLLLPQLGLVSHSL
jgi:hypothetical protein